MKIIISNCYGRFGVSKEFCDTYDIPYEISILNEPYVREVESLRTDDRLIEFIEKYGSKRASTRFANLVVKEIPSGTYYRVEEYYGLEYIEFRDEIDWKVAV